MLADALCAGLPALLGAACDALRAASPVGVGIVCTADDGHTLFTYVDVLGSTVYRTVADDLPAAFRPRVSNRVVITPEPFAIDPNGLVETRLLAAGQSARSNPIPQLQRILTQPIAGAAPALLIVAFGATGTLTPQQAIDLETIAERARLLLTASESPGEEIARLRRLEAAERLLPAFLDVLDVRQIFERLSAITRDIVRHDFASVGVFNKNLTELTLFASTSTNAPEQYTGPIPYPPSQTQTWICRFVPDLPAHPLDGQTDFAVKQGGRSSIRVAMRHGDRVLGALNLTSCDPAPYTALDLTIARRVADYIAVGISHQRLAEEGRRAAALEERNAKLEKRVKTLIDELDSRTGLRRMTGESAAWKNVVTQAAKVAVTDTTVLLLGESGSGKEIIARFVHRASRRSQAPFVALNCAALPEQLLEAELFGYERGAFTGATQSKPGHLEQAAGGTLFLDEVGEMSLQAQAKFLRVLQEREFQRLGGTRVLRSDARIVAATNLDLERAIAQGRFREDLFYRLHVFAIQLPPLRERREDILPLGETFLAEFAEHFGKPPVGFSEAAKRLLLEHHWPGNVRELRNILERAAILCEGGLITPEHLAFAHTRPTMGPPAVPGTVPVSALPRGSRSSSPPAVSGDLETVERAMIAQALERSRFNKSKAAKSLGLTRHQLYVRLRRYGFD